jgi:hypothetical protein
VSKHYEVLTLGELIEALEALPEGARVSGITGYIWSYRGYYERNGLEMQYSYIQSAVSLAAELKSRIGQHIQGWNGGDYYVSANQPVHLVTDWGNTGPNIVGLEPNDKGIYEPVTVEVRGW